MGNVSENGQYNVPRKNNLLVPILLTTVLVIGIAIIIIQVFHPFDNGNNNLPGGNNNNGYYQQDTSPNGDWDVNDTPPAGEQRSGHKSIGGN